MTGLRSVITITLVLSVLSSSCYDSTWGETKRSQARNAQAATPAGFDSRASDRPHLAPAAHVYHVRIYGTASYISQTLDWQKRVRDLFEDANEVLTDSLRLQLDIESFRRWDDAGPEDDLVGLLKSLHTRDSSPDVDWVAGFVGGIPKADPAPHELGMSDEPGKHVVLRAVSSARERDAIDHDFDQLSEDQRMTLARKRKAHAATSVLLHEIGHTLAAVHEQDPHSIMNPSYDMRMSAYSADALSLMRVTLAFREQPLAQQDDRVYAKQLLAILRGPSANAWIRADREDLVQRLEQAITSLPPATTATASAATATSPPPISDEPLLRANDQPICRRATELLQSGDAVAAASIAKPLFSAYPSVCSVQDLRCKIAMKRDGWPAAEKECKPLLDLSK